MAKKRNNKWVYRIREQEPNGSIIDTCIQVFPILGSKSAVKKAMGSGRLYLNGKPANYADQLKKGDILELRGAGLSKVKKFDIDLEILFEDDYLIVVNKPGGIAVNGSRNKTVENGLAGRVRPSCQADALPHPVAVHRIDVPTTGLVLLARTKMALITLSRAFQKNQVQKEYLAVVHGQAPKNGEIHDAIGGKPAQTYFETIHTVPSRIFRHLSLVRLRPLSGRTHQLRIHLSNAGHSIVGDKQYMREAKTILGKGLLLHAAALEFKHPITGKSLQLRADPPAKFEKIMQREAERFSR